MCQQGFGAFIAENASLSPPLRHHIDIMRFKLTIDGRRGRHAWDSMLPNLLQRSRAAPVRCKEIMFRFFCAIG